MSRPVRNTLISLFVLFWLALFHYESLRAFYLEPLAGRALPRMKFLFPPAGWIMFFRVDDSYSHAEVYGLKSGRLRRIDPHLILPTRFIGFDNTHRNVLSRILQPGSQRLVCRYLERKLPGFDRFIVTAVQYPSLTRDPDEVRQNVVYECPVNKKGEP